MPPRGDDWRMIVLSAWLRPARSVSESDPVRVAPADKEDDGHEPPPCTGSHAISVILVSSTA